MTMARAIRRVSLRKVALAAPLLGGAGGPMDQKAVTTTPTTSAWAAITSMVLVTVSNMRMGRSPMPEKYPARRICA